MSQWFGVFQKFGKALMVPVALLPAAGILLGLGAALTGPLAESWTFLQNGTVEAISAGMLQIGLSIFANLPIIFAIGVAVGLSGGSGIAALAIQEALGGRDNIIDIDACFTRLRVELKDVSQIDEDELKALGAAGVVKVKNNIQAIFGGRSDLYKNELLKLHKEMDQAN